MAYTPTVYANDNPPAINADNLNKSEQGIVAAHSDIAKLKNEINNTMIKPTVEVVQNYYVRGDNGATSSSNSYVATDYIDISGAVENTAILFRASFYQYIGVAFYNKYKQYISGISGTSMSGLHDTINMSAKIPANAVYFRASMNKTYYENADSFEIYYQDSYGIKDTNENVAKNRADIDNLIIKAGVVGDYSYNIPFEQGAIGGGGVAYNSDTSIRTGFVGITKGQYHAKPNIANTKMYFFAYDSSKTFLRYKGSWGATSALNFNVLEDEAYLRMSILYANGATITPVDNAIGLSIVGIYDEIVEARADFETLNERLDDMDGEVPAYYNVDNYFNNKIYSLQNKIASMGKGIVFAFITDIHIADNSKSSKCLMKKILDSVPVSLIISGGDIITAYTKTAGNDEQELMEQSKIWNKWVNFWGVERVFQLRGNHDYVIMSRTGDTYFNMPDISVRKFVQGYSELNKNIEYGSDSLSYYKIDITDPKIRFIILDPHFVTSSQPKAVVCWITPTQVNWLIDMLNASDGWDIVVINHETLDSTMSGYSENLEIVATILKQFKARGTVHEVAVGALIDADFTNATGNLICTINGHSHVDESHVDDDVLSIATTCDAKYGTGREYGTITESAFDVFCIDTTAKTIQTTRIGNGSDRSWYYENGDGHSIGDSVE